VSETRHFSRRVLGVLFIIFSMYPLAFLRKALTYYDKDGLPMLWVGARCTNLFFRALLRELPMLTVLVVLWGACVYLIMGIGILRRRHWTRYLALILLIDVLASVLWNHWVLCVTMPYLSYTAASLPLIAAALFFLIKTRTRAEPGSAPKRVGLAPRLLVGLSILLVVLKLLPAPLFMWIMKTENQDTLSWVNRRPQKTVYESKDYEHIDAGYKRKEVFGYSICLPENLTLLSAGLAHRSTALIVRLRGTDSEGREIGYWLTSQTRWESVFRWASYYYLFSSNSYACEKALSYPSWRPLHLWLKTSLSDEIDWGFDRIEDARSPEWRGFLRTYPRRSWIGSRVKSSLYDFGNESSAEVTIVFEDESATTTLAAHILSSVRFDVSHISAEEHFLRAKTAQAKGELGYAAIDLVNAMYVAPENPEYAYCLADMLMGMLDKDKDPLGSGLRLGDAEGLLRRAIRLDPAYEEALELEGRVKKIYGDE